MKAAQSDRPEPDAEGRSVTLRARDIGPGSPGHRQRPAPWLALAAPLALLRRDRELIAALIARDVDSQVRGTVLGRVWLVFGPIFMLIVYTLVFGVILNSRWQDRTDEAFLFPLIYFSGLILFGLFFDSLSRAPNLMRDNKAFIQKIVFPVESLCLAVVGASLIKFCIGLSILAAFYLALRGLPPPAAMAYPPVLAGLVLFSLGATWILAGLAVFFRDLAHVMHPLSMLLLFLSPLFYPLERVPATLQTVVLIANPLAYPLEATRNALFFGEWPSMTGVLVYLALGWLFALAGYRLFMRLRPGFADVI